MTVVMIVCDIYLNLLRIKQLSQGLGEVNL